MHPISVNTRRRKTALCLLASMAMANAMAQPLAYPNRPVKVIVPYAVGGATDVLARVTMDAVSKSLGQPFAIENRAGAGVVVGSNFVSKSPADGYTLLVTTSASSWPAPARSTSTEASPAGGCRV